MSAVTSLPKNYVAGGTVQASDGIYIRRAADDILYDYCRRGEFAYVLTSRQMGKSSLMVHAAERLGEEGIRPVIIDLTEMGVEITSDQWYRGLAEEIAQQLELASPAGPWWQQHEHLGVSQRFNKFLTDVVLREIPERLVLFIDEIDTTLRLSFTDDFFASIRFLYNSRATNKDLERLSFVLLGVASPGDLIKDRERTPFNIGKRVELSDFQKADLLREVGSTPEMVEGVFAYTSGHPYLTLRIFRSLAETPLTSILSERIESLFYGEQAKRDSNLQFVRDCLTKATGHDALLRKYAAVRSGKAVADKESDPACVGLHLAGVVRGVGGFLHERNVIYSRVFNPRWIKQNRDVNWVKRGTWAAAAVAALLAVVGVILLPLALEARKLRNEVKVQQLHVRQQESDRSVLDLRLLRERQELQQISDNKAIAQQQIQDLLSQTDQTKENRDKLDAIARTLETHNKMIQGQTVEMEAQAATVQSQKALLDTQAGALQKQVADLTEQAVQQKKIAEDAVRSYAELRQATATFSRGAPAVAPAAPGPTSGALVIYSTGTLKLLPKGHKDSPSEIYVDGKPVGFVVPATSFQVQLSPGAHTVCVADIYSPCAQTSIEIHNGTSTYLKMTPNIRGLAYEPTQTGASQSDRQTVAPKATPADQIIDSGKTPS